VVLVAVAAASAALCASAQAAPVTIGSPLEEAYTPGLAEGQSYLAVDTVSTSPYFQAVSPVDGVVIRWRLLGAEGAGFQLFTLRDEMGKTYTVTGESPSATPSTKGVQTFAADLPIAAGETVGLYVPPGDKPAIVASGIDHEAVIWEPAIGLGATAEGNQIPAEYAFDAVIQPAPTISLLGTSGGPAAGGTEVKIAGTDLEGTTSVRFGTIPAGFTQVSEGLVDAISPPGTAGSSVPISLTTQAGTAASSSQTFTYEAATGPGSPTPSGQGSTSGATCTVPNLVGKTLKASKKLLKRADCGLGKVTRKKGASPKNDKVTKQNPKSGKVPAPATKVKLTLG